jgi:hypothetical protein
MRFLAGALLLLAVACCAGAAYVSPQHVYLEAITRTVEQLLAEKPTASLQQVEELLLALNPRLRADPVFCGLIPVAYEAARAREP